MFSEEFVGVILEIEELRLAHSAAYQVVLFASNSGVPSRSSCGYEKP
jgi:hypothetical protein